MGTVKLIKGKVRLGVQLREEIDRELDKENPDKSLLKRHRATVNRIFDNTTRLYDRYEYEMIEKPAITAAEVDEVIRQREEDLASLQDIIEILNEALDVPVQSETLQRLPARTTLPAVKLPFSDGTVMQFQGFGEQFQDTVGSREDLKPIDKLCYLKGQLKGEAYDYISGFTHSGANYEAVVDTLKQEFGNQGAQQTFICSDLARKLELASINKVDLAINGFVGARPKTSYEVVRVKVRVGNTFNTIKAVVIDELPDNIRVDGLANTIKYLKESGIKLADPHISGNVITNIGILIGVDHYEKFVGQKIKRDQITLYKTPGGYMPCGELPEQHRKSETNMCSILVATVGLAINPLQTEQSEINEEEQQVPKLWELESIGIKEENYTPEEITAYETYHHTAQYHDHQYWVKMPFKVGRPHVPTNYHLARKAATRVRDKLRDLIDSGELI